MYRVTICKAGKFRDYKVPANQLRREVAAFMADDETESFLIEKVGD